MDNLCKRCYHNYVCEQYNENRDLTRTKCDYKNSHFVDSTDVIQVRHGQWAYYDTYIDGITIFRCTCCGDLQSGRDGWGWKKNYCPNCGAKMDSDRL